MVYQSHFTYGVQRVIPISGASVSLGYGKLAATLADEPIAAGAERPILSNDVTMSPGEMM